MKKNDKTQVNISDSLIKNTNIPRTYGLIKLHKNG